MKKKVVSLLVVSAMAATMLAGCGSEPAASSSAPESSSASSEAESSSASSASTSEATTEASTADSTSNADYSDVTLTFWSMWNSTEPQGKVIQAAADKFKEQTGATVNIEWKGRDINTIISTALEAGEDIDIFEDDYSRISKTYKNYCYDLTDMAKAADYDSKSFKCFNDKAIEWSGFLSCITEQPQVGGIFYNKDIFEDCGITSVPTTWEQFMKDCQTMVDKGYEPMALDGAYADFWLGYHLDRLIGEEAIADLAKNGGWSESEGAVKAAQQLIDFVKAGYLADGAPDEYPASENKMGLTQKVAMVVCANYVAAEVNNNTGVELNWGMFNYPAVEGGADPSNAYAGANSLAISSYSKNPQAAFDFLMLLTSGEFDQQMADAASQIPADPSNTAPAIMNGTIEALQATTAPLSWNMGLNENSDLKANFKDIAIKLFEGKYATGEEFTAAMDALY